MKTVRKCSRAVIRAKGAARSKMPGFVVLDLDHYEALRWNGRAGFRAVPEFVQAIDVRRQEFSAPAVEQRAHHLAHHITKKRPPANGKDQLLVVRRRPPSGQADSGLGGSHSCFLVAARCRS